MVILYMCFILRLSFEQSSSLSFQQELRLSVADLKDPIVINGWTETVNGITGQYSMTNNLCGLNLLLLNQKPSVYRKSFTITDFEYDQMYFEMDLYFMIFSESKIRVYVNSNLIFQQKFTTVYMNTNSICGNSDSQYTIYQQFYTQQTTLNLEIWFTAASSNSKLGVRNLNIYTNGHRLSNGCSMNAPYLQAAQCVQYCSNANSYLGGDDLLTCKQGVAGQPGLIGQYLTNQGFVWKFTNPSPSAQEYLYLTASYYLLNNNIYSNIMYSELFTSEFVCDTQYYYLSQSIQSAYKLQITFIFYILGDWDDESQVGLYIIGDTIYQNNMVKIFKQNGIYQSSTGSGIHQTKIVSPNGSTITVRRTLIAYQADFYNSIVKIGFSQNLKGISAKYGLGNIYIYELQNDPIIILSGLYGLPYKCINNYYAYNSYCVQNCPIYSYVDLTNNNCTDFSQQYSTIFSNSITTNQYGTYIIKEFYNNNFNKDNIDRLFKIVPAPFLNYQNGQSFSFVGNKKIIGGYNSWGSGTYGITLNLPKHNQIRVYFKLYMIDDWGGSDQFVFYYDGISDTYTKTNPNIQLQGKSTLDQMISVSKVHPHTSSSLIILFFCTLQSANSNVASCGISDLFVLTDLNTDIICPSQSNYFSYFTNNCENCQTSGCQLYPTYTPVAYTKCSSGCLNCLSSSICNTCDVPSGYQSNGNTCSCLGGYVQQSTCDKCHYSCYLCIGTLSNQCTSCDSTRTLISGVCQCNANRSDVFSQQQCEAINSLASYCHYSCATCISVHYYHCLTCPPGSHRSYYGFNTCPCDSQYVDIGQTNCVQITCDATCQTCDGPQESNCLSCASNFRLESGYCMCDGVFNNIVQPDSCVSNSNSCDETCLQCFNQTALGCISCNPSFHRFLDIDEATNQQQCSCYDGYFDQNRYECQQCDQQCLTCETSATHCLTCDSNTNRSINAVLNTCLCISDYNDNLNPGQSCVQNLTNCHYSCQKCFGQANNQCLVCDTTYRVLNIDNLTCDCLAQQYDNGQLQCLNCHQTCLTCTGNLINNCLTCDSSIYRIIQSNQCVCQIGYNNKLIINKCEEDILNGCHTTCLTCFSLGQNQCLTCPSDRYLQSDSCFCKSIYFEQLNQCQLCHYSCLTCSNSGPGDCIICDVQNFRSKIIDTCTCISGYVDVGDPLCQACPNDCQDCDSQFHCVNCRLSNSIVNNLGRCECQDGYFSSNQQCLNCHHSCLKCLGQLNTQCTECKQGKFRKLTESVCQCFDGYQENNNEQCVDCQSDEGKQIFSCQYQNAQDGVWTYGEQCDDGNHDARDGCNNFQITSGYSCTNIFNQQSICYKCSDNCQKCQQTEDQIICVSCLQNYYNAQQICIQCQEKSCIECIKPSYCSVCKNLIPSVQGKCNQCKLGYYFSKDNCISLCGDGIKTLDEQCDDGNAQSSDGCSEICEIEENFVCKNIKNTSQCFFHEQPYLIYEIQQQQTNEQKKILISVSQHVTYENIQLELVQQPNIQIQYVISGNDNFKIDLQVIFNQSYTSITINLQINGMIINEYSQSLKSNKLQITLDDIIVLSESEKQTSQQVAQVSQGVVIGLFSMSTTSLFMGGVSQFVTFLNLIQQLQYIQYVNVNFPPHLMQFLNVFNGFTFASIFDVFQIKWKITQVDPQQEVFYFNGLNAYYLANMQGFIFSLFILYMIYYLQRLLILVIQKLKQYLLQRHTTKYNIYLYLNKLQKQIVKTSIQIQTEGFTQLVLTTCYDIQFAIFIQLSNLSCENLNIIINILLALINQILYFKFMVSKLQSDEMIDQGGYQKVKLMSALIFIFSIVCLQGFPQSYVLAISFTSLLVPFYLIIMQPFKNALRNWQLIIQEFSLFLGSFTFMAYDYFPQSVDPKALGWFHIFTFVTMIVGNLVIYLYQFVINLQKIYCK